MKLAGAALALMPMHLHVDARGRIVSAGATLRRLLGDASDFASAFEPADAAETLSDMAAADRIFLRPRTRKGAGVVLRGRAVALPDGGLVFNLGLGIGLVEAIHRFQLTDLDFSPADLAMEFLFLHEANNAMLAELSRVNLRLETARRQAETEAFTDPLTTLRNRRGLQLSFEALRQRMTRSGAADFALMVLDLDDFKKLNDSHGHAAGDEMLGIIARRLRAATRRTDTIARTGGDEFVLLLPCQTEPEVLAALGRRIVKRISEPVDIAGQTCRISASIGVAISTRYRQIDWPRMQADADAALYAAKRAGRGGVRIAEGQGAATARHPHPSDSGRAGDDGGAAW